MSAPQKDKRFGEFLSQAEGVAEALGDVFARAFATYTVEVLALLETRGLAAPGPASFGKGVPKDEDELESAPEWVKASYACAKQAVEPVDINEAETRARLIRNRLALALKKQQMTQSALAKRLGRSASQISRIFRNPERSRLNTLKKIADAIDVDLSDLLRDLRPPT